MLSYSICYHEHMKFVPKTSTKDGKTIHYSAGAIIVNDKNEVLLIDRATPPFGLAGIAGHVDEGEEPERAVVREVEEEIGLKLRKPELLCEEFVDWNWCGGGITGHHWHLYTGVVEGKPTIQQDEVKSANWYPIASISKLKLEPVWEHWFKKSGYI